MKPASTVRALLQHRDGSSFLLYYMHASEHNVGPMGQSYLLQAAASRQLVIRSVALIEQKTEQETRHDTT